MMIRRKAARPWLLVTGLMALLLLAVPPGALAADTKLGNYEEAPYRDVVNIYTVDFGEGLSRTYVEIPREYVFSPDKLHRTVTINGREWEDLIIVSRYKSGSYLVFDMFEQKRSRADWFFENLNTKWDPQVSEEQRERSVQNAYRAALEDTITDFLGKYWEYPFGRGGGEPIEPIVSINGRPWQETAWKDYITTHIRQNLYPSDPLLTNKQYWEVFLNPAYNGRAKEVIEAMEEQQIAIPTADQTVAAGSQVVLTLGKKEVITYRDGRADIRTLDVAPEAPEGVTMIPLRGVLDFFGANLNYDGPSRTVTVLDGDTRVELRIGKDIALVNGQQAPLLRSAEVKDGRTLIPLRFVAEGLGYQVTWVAETQQVIIRK
ncbi:MAG: copper amine oxidase N-terminal domain-containing protein [Clostridia bacterium]|nr:MAG: copper amine oxidase N-terminal domain-containing protein [Clostridia bacterium]